MAQQCIRGMNLFLEPADYPAESLRSGQCEDMSMGIRCHFTPAAQRFLDARPAEDRRRFLHDLEQRLRTEGSPIIIKRERDRPLIAYLLAGSASRGSHPEVLNLVDLGDIPVPSEG